MSHPASGIAMAQGVTAVHGPMLVSWLAVGRCAHRTLGSRHFKALKLPRCFLYN